MTQEIDIRKRTKAAPSALWRLINDSSSWPSWTPIESFKLEREGSADGIGEIRTFKTGRVQVREEIVECRFERRLSYVLLAGLAVRDYRADIDLSRTSDGTEIRWRTTFKAKLPGTGWLYHRVLTKATREFVDGLAGYATRNEPAPSA